MDVSQTCVILDRQAKLEGTGILELLQTIDHYGIRDYTELYCLDLDPEFRSAYYVFMNSARQMFAKVEA
jgi:hypothetical protein